MRRLPRVGTDLAVAVMYTRSYSKLPNPPKTLEAQRQLQAFPVLTIP